MTDLGIAAARAKLDRDARKRGLTLQWLEVIHETGQRDDRLGTVREIDHWRIAIELSRSKNGKAKYHHLAEKAEKLDQCVERALNWIDSI